MSNLREFIEDVCKGIDIYPLLNAPIQKPWRYWVNELYPNAMDTLRRYLKVEVATPDDTEYRIELAKDALLEKPMTFQAFLLSFKFASDPGKYTEDFKSVFTIVIRNYYSKNTPEKPTWNLKDYIHHHFQSIGDVEIHRLLNIKHARKWEEWIDVLECSSNLGIFTGERLHVDPGEINFMQFLQSFKLTQSEPLTYSPKDFDVAFKQLIRKYLSVVDTVRVPPKPTWTLWEYIESIASNYTRAEIDTIMKSSGKHTWDDWARELHLVPIVRKQNTHQGKSEIGVYSFFSSFRLTLSDKYLEYTPKEFDEEYHQMIARFFAYNGLPDDFQKRLYAACAKLGLNFYTVSSKIGNAQGVLKTEDEWKEDLLSTYTKNGSTRNINIEGFLRNTDDLLAALKHYATDQQSVKHMRLMEETQEMHEWLIKYRKSRLALLPPQVLASGFFDYSAYNSERHIRDEINIGVCSYCVGMLAKTRTAKEATDALYSFARSMPGYKFKALRGFFDLTIGRDQSKLAFEYATNALYYVIMTHDADVTETIMECSGPVDRPVRVNPVTETRLHELFKEYEIKLLALPVVTPPTPPVPPPPVVTPQTPPAPPPPAMTPSVPPPTSLNPAQQAPHPPIPQHERLQEYKKRFNYLKEKEYVRTKKLLELMGYEEDSFDTGFTHQQIAEKSNTMIEDMRRMLFYEPDILINFTDLADQYEGFDKYIDANEMKEIDEAYEASDRSKNVKEIYDKVKEIYEKQPENRPKQTPVAKKYTRSMRSAARTGILKWLGHKKFNGDKLSLYPISMAVRTYLRSHKAPDVTN